jgi:hypothetical protein
MAANPVLCSLSDKDKPSTTAARSGKLLLRYARNIRKILYETPLRVFKNYKYGESAKYAQAHKLAEEFRVFPSVRFQNMLS